jgi:dihydrofolate reductase
VPIFVPTHCPPAENRHKQVHFVTDGIESCVAQAKAAAGDRDVMLHGVNTAQECLRAGVLDVLEIQLVPDHSARADCSSTASSPSTSSSNSSGRWRTKRASSALRGATLMTESMTTPIRLYMSMSLDGFIAGQTTGPGRNSGATAGGCSTWLDDRMSPGTNGQVFGELMATGAVISGRCTFELAERWHGDHHDGVPVHVLTHHVDEGDVPPGSAKFYTDVVARGAAAGDRAVMVHGGKVTFEELGRYTDTATGKPVGMGDRTRARRLNDQGGRATNAGAAAAPPPLLTLMLSKAAQTDPTLGWRSPIRAGPGRAHMPNTFDMLFATPPVR